MALVVCWSGPMLQYIQNSHTFLLLVLTLHTVPILVSIRICSAQDSRFYHGRLLSHTQRICLARLETEAADQGRHPRAA